MVATDAQTAWDLKPNRENTNKIFNVLCNVQPVEHPWSGDWYARQIDVTTWSKDQFWLEKCKWLKKCELYEYNCNKKELLVIPRDDWDEDEQWHSHASARQIRNEKLWRNANFTDVVLFEWYRIYMRKNNWVLNPYWEEEKEYNWKQYVDKWWDWDKDTCDEWDRPSNVIEEYSVDKNITTARKESDRINTFNTAWRIRLYIQQVDTDWCTWDSFDWPDEAPIVLVKEYEAAECNPDHFVMWYGWIWTPDVHEIDWKISMIRRWWQRFAYLHPIEWVSLEWSQWIYLNEKSIYISWLQSPTADLYDMLWELWIEMWWWFIPNTSELTQVIELPAVKDMNDKDEKSYETTEIKKISIYKRFWEVPYFAAWNYLYSINWFFTTDDWDCAIPDEYSEVELPKREEAENACDATDVDYQKKRIFIYDNIIPMATNEEVITWLSSRWARLAYVAWWSLYVSWNGIMNWFFNKDITNQDQTRWSWAIPAWVTDLRTINWSLLLFWPKCIYAVANEMTLVQWWFVSGTDNEDWYYSPWSFYNDDWQFLLFRRWKVLWTLEVQVSYTNSISMSFDPSTGFYVNSHLKSLNNDFDMVNIDADINNRYVSIFDDNDVWEHYSKLLIYDKHYNFWYWRMITWARVIHVKDWIFLWDWIYTNKWRTRWRRVDDTKWWEIIEIISAYVWEEWLQTPKHIQYVKTAIWDHSRITDDSYRDLDTSYGWRLFERRVNITTTRYPRLLFSKNRTDTIEKYEIWEEIYWHWKLLSHNLLNEISEYRNYDKFSETIIREMWEDIDMWSKLALFASIKEPINAPANVLELCISARHLDNVQFGSFYVWYYVLDADYEDIENTNIDKSMISDTTKEQETVINKWEYCDEILAGSACDVQDF